MESLKQLDHAKLDSKTTVLVLQDLDQPVFKELTAARFDSLVKLFGSETAII